MNHHCGPDRYGAGGGKQALSCGNSGRLVPGRLEIQLSQVPRLVSESSFQSQAKTRLYPTLGREAEAGGS